MICLSGMCTLHTTGSTTGAARHTAPDQRNRTVKELRRHETRKSASLRSLNRANWDTTGWKWKW